MILSVSQRNVSKHLAKHIRNILYVYCQVGWNIEIFLLIWFLDDRSISPHMWTEPWLGSRSTRWYSTRGANICWNHSRKQSFFTRSRLGLFTDMYVSHWSSPYMLTLPPSCLSVWIKPQWTQTDEETAQTQFWAQRNCVHFQAAVMHIQITSNPFTRAPHLHMCH